MDRIASAVLGALLWTLGTEVANCQWYKVPAGGNVTFTLTELWGVFKGIPPSSFVQGDATITLEYSDGSTEEIAFQDSGGVVSGLVGSQDGWGTSFGTGQLSGTSVWTQTASLTAGRVFQIVSATPAQSYAQDVEFQGGTGAFVKGFVSKFSTGCSSRHTTFGAGHHLEPSSTSFSSRWRAFKHSRRHCFRSI